MKSRNECEEFFVEFCKRNHNLNLNEIINKTKKKLKSTKTTVIVDNDNHRKINIQSLLNNDSNNANLNIPDISLLDPRRVVFVSLLGLYRTWMNTPTFILYSCLIILPLKRSWLYETENNSNSSEGPKDSQNVARLLDKCLCIYVYLYLLILLSPHTSISLHVFVHCNIHSMFYFYINSGLVRI